MDDDMVTFQDFQKLDMRVGRIIEVDDFPEAKNPSYRLRIDFGREIGIKKSCAQATNYKKDELLGKQIIAVVNFPPKQIGPALSEVLVMGVKTESKGLALLIPDKEAVLGSRIF